MAPAAATNGAAATQAPSAEEMESEHFSPYRSDGKLYGFVCIVTGATAPVGKAVVTELAGENPTDGAYHRSAIDWCRSPWRCLRIRLLRQLRRRLRTSGCGSEPAISQYEGHRISVQIRE